MGKKRVLEKAEPQLERENQVNHAWNASKSHAFGTTPWEEIALDETGEGSDHIQGWWRTSAAEGAH